MIATKLGANIIGNVIPIATASTSLYKAPNENMLGRKLQIKFNVKGKTEWFKGTVNSYDGLTGKYGFYFPCDKQTVYMLEDDKDIRFVEW